MTITIEDDFDLAKIADSGQCFRARQYEDGTVRFVTGSHVLYIRALSGKEYDLSCTESEWQQVWRRYFDLDRSYSSIRASIPPEDIFLTAAAEEAAGLRILRQDTFEMLVTSILTQRKSIPAIMECVEMLCSTYGTPIDTGRELLYRFPTPQQLLAASEAELRRCKLGYRAPYVMDAADAVTSGRLDLDFLDSLTDEELMTELKTVRGVGDKVASCIALFACGRIALAPIDTWILQIIDAEYGGRNPFPGYGADAGILQQYMFYYAIHHKQALHAKASHAAASEV